MKNKEESEYEEARRTVSELNDTPGVQSEGEFFIYTETGWCCGINLGALVLWHTEDNDRRTDEETGENEPLKTCVLRKVEELRESLNKILEGVKADEA